MLRIRTWSTLVNSSSGIFFRCKSSQLPFSRSKYAFPVLNAEELEEHFTSGGGPGGQKLNKAVNCVQLKHLPTGIVVKCQETRSLEKNREIARRRLQELVDFRLNGDNSFLAQQDKAAQEKEKAQRARAKRNLEKKEQFRKTYEDWQSSVQAKQTATADTESKPSS